MTSVGIQPFTLSGHGLRLEPARTDHAEAMHGAADAATFALFTRQPMPWSVDGCRAYLRFLIDHPTTLAMSLFDADTDRLIGGTSYCDIRPAHRGVEIGWTWITPSLRGSAVNPAMKLMLLGHAFETDLFDTGPAIRAALKTHHRNLRSQAAIAKLGAVHEGTLRRHVIMPDGSYRDSVIYSITTAEWPAVQAGLRARVYGAGPG